jgi:hypothetical protein
MTNLVGLYLSQNQLTNLVLPPDLFHLETLNVGGNQLTSLNLPSGLTNLTGLFFVGNQLTNVTLPPDMTRVVELGFLSNPLVLFVLSELAATNLAAEVPFLQSQGIPVFAYPLTVQLVKPRPSDGAFQFGITGPPGIYTVLGSTNLAAWSVVRAVTNRVGALNFHDVTGNLIPQKFYRCCCKVRPRTWCSSTPIRSRWAARPTNSIVTSMKVRKPR